MAGAGKTEERQRSKGKETERRREEETTTTDQRLLMLRRYTELDTDLRLQLAQLKLVLPEQPPPRAITTS